MKYAPLCNHENLIIAHSYTGSVMFFHVKILKLHPENDVESRLPDFESSIDGVKNLLLQRSTFWNQTKTKVGVNFVTLVARSAKNRKNI
jgi:hypothetical protein